MPTVCANSALTVSYQLNQMLEESEPVVSVLDNPSTPVVDAFNTEMPMEIANHAPETKLSISTRTAANSEPTALQVNTMMPVTFAKTVPKVPFTILLPTHALPLTQWFKTADVTKNSALSQTHASNAQLDKPVTMLTRDAKHNHKTAMPKVEFNWTNNNATHAESVELVRPSTSTPTAVVLFKPSPDHNVPATKSTTKIQTPAETAQSVNFQTTTNSTKTEDVLLPPRVATTTTRFNWVKLSAINANHVPLVKSSTETPTAAWSNKLDHHAHATKSTTKIQTPAETAQPVNSQPLSTKMVN